MRSSALRRLLLGLAVLALFAPTAMAGHLVQWTYDTADPPDITNNSVGPVTPADIGVGTATSFHARTQTDWTNPSGNGADHGVAGGARSQSSNEWSVGDYYQFQVDTLLCKDIILQWDQTRSGTGPVDFKLQSSTDGVTFTDELNYVVLLNDAANGGTWSAGGPYLPAYHFTADLSANTALNDQPAVYFRLTATSIGSSTNGTNRVDNFQMDSTQIPEPASAVLLAMAGLAFAAFTRRSAV
jgi:hypothetical protein